MPEIVNTAQEQAWNGPEGTHWARHQDRWNAVNEGFDEPLLTAARIAEDTRTRTLDIGCGAGQTTVLAARRAPAGRALGLDLSGPMLAEARARAAREGVGNAAFVQGDAQTHPLEDGAFDAAVSRYGVMFFADPEAAFGNIARALRPGGRLAFVCPAEPGLNDWLVAMTSLRDLLPVGDLGTPGQPGMFSLSAPDRIRAVLTPAGLTDIAVDRADAHGNWGSDAEDAADFLLLSGPGQHFTAQVDQATRDRARQTLTDHLRAHETADGTVRLRSASWLVTATRP
ncbi:methyltransferase domain-containing protein [Streptomyces sp. SKN60]|uniref:class I SAM-dependent methyltransferase n=1 Tax=Streptomyces sp. SKN60 TaxID=2855506 RepID=UPI0022482590|nr:class I SAM-dependent methyltransferase [Streptomyces sp. SKN60]MCX2179653.1 methyltransferase domain-containing protein [Streptomyces sp. SKN60]